MNKFPEYIMQYLRQRRGLYKQDTSEDEQINNMNNDRVFSEVCKANGLLYGYDSEIKNWIQDIYKVELNSK